MPHSLRPNALRLPVRRLRRRLRPRQRPRFRGQSFNRVIPNLLTMIGLCAGLTSIRFALEGRFGAAAVAITVAGAIDGLDGRLARLLKATSRFGAEFDSLADFLCFGIAPGLVMYLWSLQAWGAMGFLPPLMYTSAMALRLARLLKATSRFGAEFDSLADFCCFGIAPALLVYMWALEDQRGYGYVPCVLFAVCMGLRLARFNASLDQEKTPPYAYNFFTGVPAPAGAALALLPMLVGLEANQLGWGVLYDAAAFPLVSAACLVVTAGLLVSTLPVWSFKNFRIPSQFVLPTLLCTGAFAALLVADPWAGMALAVMGYAVSLPFGVRSFHRLRREAVARRAEIVAFEADTPLDA